MDGPMAEQARENMWPQEVQTLSPSVKDKVERPFSAKESDLELTPSRHESLGVSSSHRDAGEGSRRVGRSCTRATLILVMFATEETNFVFSVE